MIEVFLAGEGTTELGGWSREIPYRNRHSDKGILEALLAKIRTSGWEINDAIRWKHIVKFRAGLHRAPEVRNVLGAALRADETHCDALVFSRDRDGDSDRERDIEEGIIAVQREFPDLKVAGGVAIEEIESWVLSCTAHMGAESILDAKDALKKSGVDTLSMMVAKIESADLGSLPGAARSLRKWLERANSALQE